MRVYTIFAALLGPTSTAAMPRLYKPPTSETYGLFSPRLDKVTTRQPHPRSILLSSESSATVRDTGSVRGGAVLSRSDITYVSGTFSVPVPEMPTSGPTSGDVAGLYGASFWVGIDGGLPATQSSLRAGVDIFWDEGTVSAVAWYQWYPLPSTDLTNFNVTPGDVICTTVQTTDTAQGNVTIENFGSGVLGADLNGLAPLQTATQIFTNQSNVLLRKEAAWIVEDFPMPSLPELPIALANFSSVMFESLEIATLADGFFRVADDSQILNIELEEQGGQLTDCSILESGDVECLRVVEGV